MIRRIVCVVGVFLQSAGALAPGQTKPPDGLRNNTPGVHAFIHARIVQSPGKVIQDGVLVMRDGIVESVGHLDPPPDARVWNMKGLTVYPGLIDAYSDYGMPKPSPGNNDDPHRGADYWNSAVLADRRAVDQFKPDEKVAEKLRSIGITTVLTLPAGGIFRGTSALVTTGSGTTNELVLKSDVAQHITLVNTPASQGYPNSLMGAIALIRQTFLDADWYGKAHAAYATDPALPRPETNEPLEALGRSRQRHIPFVIESYDERSVLRARKIGDEFSLNLIIRGSGVEYRRLDAVAGTRTPLLLPINFPEPPLVGTPEEALQVSLADLRYWDEAPENPARLRKAGVPIAIFSSSLKDNETVLAMARKATLRGLSRDEALAALTTAPATMFGVETRLGELEPGKIANIVVTDGDLFDATTVVRETWISGKRYETKSSSAIDPRATWNITWTLPVTADSIIVIIKGKPETLAGTLRAGKTIPLVQPLLSDFRLSFSFAGDSLGIPGRIRMTAILSSSTLEGTGALPDGASFNWRGTVAAPFAAQPDSASGVKPSMASFPPVYPEGAFGRATIPAQPAALIVRNATLWTCGPGGTIPSVDVLIEKGKIVRIGKGLQIPRGAMVIDATGKHITPGIIDCHSHMAIDGSVNETGQAISAEVRIGDVIDSDDIALYRALAGGVTTAHILHGSANPIGGQCQLIKLRWGMLPEQMKFENAPPTIKFALGENVKQSNWGDASTRYPQTRMGVEQIIRDEFRAGLDYTRRWDAYRKKKTGIPPRRDLELDAITEVLQGKRFIHCHSYRQDEILAMIRVADDFGIHIAAFQHILEGYKVADILASHTIGASAFSDWWAYKIEVYDAIPYNGVLMHDQGVVVSYNSDSDELTRRLNLEATKAVKYGGLSEEEALKFVTLNPAKQLKVDSRVGSLEPGKDADFVVWSGSPLSGYSVCEQTWIDGRRFFDREEDQAMRSEAEHERAVLVQKVLTETGTRTVADQRGKENRKAEHQHRPNGVQP